MQLLHTPAGTAASPLFLQPLGKPKKWMERGAKLNPKKKKKSPLKKPEVALKSIRETTYPSHKFPGTSSGKRRWEGEQGGEFSMKAAV